MIRHGAQQVFASKDSDITDDDIDMILKRGEEKVRYGWSCCSPFVGCNPHSFKQRILWNVNQTPYDYKLANLCYYPSELMGYSRSYSTDIQIRY